jgi:hypothetical protein
MRFNVLVDAVNDVSRAGYVQAAPACDGEAGAPREFQVRKSLSLRLQLHAILLDHPALQQCFKFQGYHVSSLPSYLYSTPVFFVSPFPFEFPACPLQKALQFICQMRHASPFLFSRQAMMKPGAPVSRKCL